MLINEELEVVEVTAKRKLLPYKVCNYGKIKVHTIIHIYFQCALLYKNKEKAQSSQYKHVQVYVNVYSSHCQSSSHFGIVYFIVDWRRSYRMRTAVVNLSVVSQQTISGSWTGAWTGTLTGA